MLKAEVENIGIPDKGVPQGGILSPLLANVVLNELDYWISSQWENIKTGYNYKEKGDEYRALRKNTKLKEMYIIRYADDFKIVCKKLDDAHKTYEATKKWLKERLYLEVNEDKSGITNIKH